MSTSGGATAGVSYAAPASMNGYKAWTFDPAVTSNLSVALAAGVASYTALWVPAPITVNTISAWVQTAAVGASNTYLGLFSATAQLGITADVSANWTAVGAVANALTAAVTLPAGVVYVAELCGAATTVPILSRVSLGTSAMVNVGIAPVANTLNARRSTLGTALTALPATIVGTPAQVSNATWFALS